MTVLAKWVERFWHGPHTRKRNQTHHRPVPTTHAAVTTWRKP